MVPLDGVIKNHVQNDLQPGLVQGPDHLLEGDDLLAPVLLSRPWIASLGVADGRGREYRNFRLAPGIRSAQWSTPGRTWLR